MDRGIATAENVKWLSENGYSYIIIKREDDSALYREIFETQRHTFERVSSNKSVYGEENKVYVHKEPCADTDNISRILCYSEGKARKEQAIADKKGNPFLEDIAHFRQSIQKGTIKNKGKIEAKLQRMIIKHGRKAADYDTTFVLTDGKITDVSAVRKTMEETPLYGCYVIESTHKEMTPQEIWKLYMTLTRVESAFRSMKETLGLRPIYHQKAERTESHLFITVMAYHLLAVIENIMTQQGDTRTWATLRDVMSTLMRGTVSMRDIKGITYLLRISGEPESEHQDILDKLGIHSLPKQVISVIDTL
jgi:transposase